MNKYLPLLLLILPLSLYGQKNVISGSTQSVIQSGDNSKVTFNINVALDDLEDFFREKAAEEKIAKLSDQVEDLPGFVEKLEAYLDELDDDLESIKEEDESTYREGKKNVTRTRIAIQEIKNFSSNFAIKDTTDAYGNRKFYIVKESDIKVTESIYAFISDFEDGLALVKFKNKYGYVDYSGIEVIPPQYDAATTFKEGLAVVERKDLGLRHLINKSREVVADLSQYKRVQRIENGYYLLHDSYSVELLDSLGKSLINSSDFSSLTWAGYKDFFIAKKRRKNGFGLIASTGEEQFPFSFSQILPFEEYCFTVQQNGKWGYKAPSGDLKIGFIYDEATNFKDGYAKVKINGKWALIDYIGIQHLSPEFDSIGDWTEDEIAVVYKGLDFSFTRNGDCLDNCNLFYQLKNGKTWQGNLVSIGEDEIVCKLFEQEFRIQIKDWKLLNSPDLFNNLSLRSNEGYTLVRREKVGKDSIYVIRRQQSYQLLDNKGAFLWPEAKVLDYLGPFNDRGIAEAKRGTSNFLITFNGKIKKTTKTKVKGFGKQVGKVFEQKRGDYPYAILESDPTAYFRQGWDFSYVMAADDGLSLETIFRKDTSITLYKNPDFVEKNLFNFQFGFGFTFDDYSKVNGFSLIGGILMPVSKLIDVSDESEVIVLGIGAYIKLAYEWEPIPHVTITPFFVPSITGPSDDTLQGNDFLSGRTYETNFFNYMFGVRLGYKFYL